MGGRERGTEGSQQMKKNKIKRIKKNGREGPTAQQTVLTDSASPRAFAFFFAVKFHEVNVSESVSRVSEQAKG